jgi:hypothetical protein
MLQDRKFNIVWVNEKNGTGLEPAKQAQIVQYAGKEIRIKE